MDRHRAGSPHGEGPPLPRPDFRAPPPPWLLPRPPSGAPPPPRPPPDTRVPPHLLTWETIVSWPPPGASGAPETLWHRDHDDRVPNEGEMRDSGCDGVEFATARRRTRRGGEEEEEEEEERFELNEAWLERFARTEMERRARAKERRKEARREERVVVPAAVAAAARVEKELAERRERERARGAEEAA